MISKKETSRLQQDLCKDNEPAEEVPFRGKLGMEPKFEESKNNFGNSSNKDQILGRKRVGSPLKYKNNNFHLKSKQNGEIFSQNLRHNSFHAESNAAPNAWVCIGTNCNMKIQLKYDTCFACRSRRPENAKMVFFEKFNNNSGTKNNRDFSKGPRQNNTFTPRHQQNSEGHMNKKFSSPYFMNIQNSDSMNPNQNFMKNLNSVKPNPTTNVPVYTFVPSNMPIYSSYSQIQIENAIRFLDSIRHTNTESILKILAQIPKIEEK
jgi:hypothetical protein